MYDLCSTTSDNKAELISIQEPAFGDIISVAEFKEYFKDQELSEDKAKEMKNNLVGIVNSVINFYLEDFK